jgi:hypothetical protein
MTRMQIPSREILFKSFHYDREKGVLIWKVRPISDFNGIHPLKTCSAWNSRCAGKPAGCISPNGYVVLSFLDKTFSAHRLIAAMVMDDFDPEMEIDHINHIRHDNRIENLRQVTKSENAKNLSLPNTNKSGVAGVIFCKQRKKWIARLQVNGKTHNGKRHVCFFRAVQDRQEMLKKHKFYENHGSKQ